MQTAHQSIRILLDDYIQRIRSEERGSIIFSYTEHENALFTFSRRPLVWVGRTSIDESDVEGDVSRSKSRRTPIDYSDAIPTFIKFYHDAGSRIDEYLCIVVSVVPAKVRALFLVLACTCCYIGCKDSPLARLPVLDLHGSDDNE